MIRCEKLIRCEKQLLLVREKEDQLKAMSGIQDGQKKTLLAPAHSDVEVPVIKKLKAQVVSVGEETAQLMDAETYEVYDIKVTDEFKGKLNAGAEVEVMLAMGRKALSRVLTG